MGGVDVVFYNFFILDDSDARGEDVDSFLFLRFLPSYVSELRSCCSDEFIFEASGFPFLSNLTVLSFAF